MTYRRVLVLVVALLVGVEWGGKVAGASEKVTICHAAGQEDTDKYVTLTISRNAVYKDQGGHFYENGTPRAGHEHDYLGPCKTDTVTSPTTTIPDNHAGPGPTLIPPTYIERPTPVIADPSFTG